MQRGHRPDGKGRLASGGGLAKALLCLGWFSLSLTEGHAGSASANYAIPYDTIDGGGGPAAAGATALVATMGGLGEVRLPAGTTATVQATYAGQLNDPPLPGSDAVQRPPGEPIKFPTRTLTANDADPEGDSFTVSIGVGTTQNGGTVSLAGDWVFYTPPAGPAGDSEDSFEYLVTDGCGVAAAGRVVVTTAVLPEDPGDILNPPNLLTAQRIGDLLVLRFAGVPGRLYKLQTRASLNPGEPWLDYLDGTTPLVVTADAIGVYQITVPISGTWAFFRTITYTP